MLTLAVHQFWYEKSLAVCHSQIFANFVCSTAFWSRIFKWGIYFFDLDCARSYLNTLIYTCMQVYFSILNKICDMRVTSSGCFDVECLNFGLQKQLLYAFFYIWLASSFPKLISLVENDLARWGSVLARFGRGRKIAPSGRHCSPTVNLRKEIFRIPAYLLVMKIICKN